MHKSLLLATALSALITGPAFAVDDRVSGSACSVPGAGDSGITTED